MIRLPEYTKPVAEYKPEAQLILGKPCYVQEKFDGSQFTFGYLEGKFYARSRGQQICEELGIPDLFAEAFLNAKALCEDERLPPNMLFRCEAICKPKHNSLKYDRIPQYSFIVYDIQDAVSNEFMPPAEVEQLLGGVCEFAPTLGVFPDGFVLRSQLCDYLDANQHRLSKLGGAIEGYVFKELSPHPERAIVKLVRDNFKELHAGNPDWERTGNKTGLEKVMQKLAGPARYTKALAHLKERGESEGSMRDMPKLMKELHSDLDSDNAEIRELLWEVFGKEIKRQLGGGLALWYKDQLRNA